MNYWDNDNNENSWADYGYNPDKGLNDMEPAPRRNRSNAKRESSPKYVTRRAFALGIILSMLLTSALTMGGIMLLGGNAKAPQQQSEPNTISANNYTLAASTGTQKSVEEIVAMNENAVVEIQTEMLMTDSWMMNYVTQGAGSGVIISPDGYILTCNHVIEGAKSVSVTTKDGSVHEAQVIGVDALTDVAVIKIDGSEYVSANFGDSESLSVGDLAVAIGNPLGKLGGSASVGIISSLDRELEVEGTMMNLLQTDASINPGNSGGGLFDGEGNLIGIVVAKSSGSDIEGLGFAIPINTASKIAEDLMANGKVTGRPLIGVTVIDASDAAIAREYGYQIPGLYIYDVSSDAAKEAGLQKDDMIQAVNGVSLTSRSDLSAEINKYSPGDTVTLTILRENRTMDVDTVLIGSDEIVE